MDEQDDENAEQEPEASSASREQFFADLEKLSRERAIELRAALEKQRGNR